jgi:hypothetical protein
MRKIGPLAVAFALLVLSLSLLSVPEDREPSAAAESGPGAGQAVLTVTPSRGRAVPRSFFGLSTEYWTLPLYERHARPFERVLSLLHVRGDGPLILRIGGDSADHTSWDPRSLRAPRWVYRVTPAWLGATRRLITRLGLRVILDMNLVTGSPFNAAALARAAEIRLPRGSIAGIEIGNEPDIYDRTFWIGSLAWGRRRAPLPAHLTPASYRTDFLAYAHRLSGIARRAPLVGPALANPHSDAGWIARLLRGPHPGLRMISVHHYALSACARPGAPNHPTVDRILSERASAGAADSLGRAIRLAHRAGLPIRLTELNSVTCGGLRGVSNSFATALWAPDALFTLLRAGIDGLNIHVREYAINAPFTLTTRGLYARPLLYGMIAFARTLGPGARLLPVHLSEHPGLHLKAWAVGLRGHLLHVLLIDKGRRSISVRLRVPAGSPARVQRLLARSIGATTGTTLAGQRLSAAGTWAGHRAVERIPATPGGYQLRLPAYSAALVSLR